MMAIKKHLENQAYSHVRQNADVAFDISLLDHLLKPLSSEHKDGRCASDEEPQAQGSDPSPWPSVIPIAEVGNGTIAQDPHHKQKEVTVTHSLSLSSYDLDLCFSCPLFRSCLQSVSQEM